MTEPDPQIIKKEDENLNLTKKASGEELGNHRELPPRPGYGRGTRFPLRTNYFRVNLDANLDLFRYRVMIEPLSESARTLQNRRKRRQFFNILFEEVFDFQMRGGAVATDYAHTLITRGRLFDKDVSERKYRQIYRGEYEPAKGQNDPPRPNEQSYTVTVKIQGKVSISELIRYIEFQPTDVSDFVSSQDAIQVLNIIVAGTPNKDTNVFQSGQNKFFRYPRNENDQSYIDAYRSCDLGGCLIAVRGYYSSIRTSTSRILLNLNAQCSPFYREVNLLAMINQLKGNPIRMMNDEVEEFISKLRVRTDYTKNGNKQVTKVKSVRGFSHTW